MSISLDPTPITSTDLLTLFDQRPLSSLQVLPGIIPSLYSTYTIPAPVGGISTVLLRENPQQQQAAIPTGVSVTQVPGGPFVEVLTSPGAGQFVVNYLNGSLVFNGADVGKVITAAYTGVGSEVRAETINNITRLLVPLYNTVNGITIDNTNFTFTNVHITGNLTVDGGETDPKLTDAQELALVLGPTDAGRMWFNTTSSQFKGWNGTAIVILG